MNALVLIAHGSRRAEANEDLDYIVEGMRRRGMFDLVRRAFLELAEPTIAEAVASCVDAGAARVVMMPYFLSPGVHVTDDLEAARRDFATRFPQVEFRLAPPLGRHPKLVEIVAERCTDMR